jgi:hypothetical protein
MIRLSPSPVAAFLLIAPFLAACSGAAPGPAAGSESTEVGVTDGNEESPDQANPTISTSNTAYATVTAAQWTAAGKLPGAVISNGGNTITINRSASGGSLTITATLSGTTVTAVLSNLGGTARFASWNTLWQSVQSALPEGIKLQGSTP